MLCAISLRLDVHFAVQGLGPPARFEPQTTEWILSNTPVAARFESSRGYSIALLAERACSPQRIVRSDWDTFLAWKQRHGVTVVGTSDKAEQDYRAAPYPAPLVILMGSERAGLSPAQQAACDRMLRIPMVGRSDSLNLAVATALVLYEAFYWRSRRA